VSSGKISTAGEYVPVICYILSISSFYLYFILLIDKEHLTQLPFLRFSCQGYRFRHVPLAGLVRVKEDVNGQMAMYGV